VTAAASVRTWVAAAKPVASTTIRDLAGISIAAILILFLLPAALIAAAH
jgi:hypothetical protein